jgi:hypothetical protein
MMRLSSRHLMVFGGVLAAVLLSGCEYSGLNERDYGLSGRKSYKNFAVVEASTKRAVFKVRKKRIVVEPPQGYCLDDRSIAVTPKAGFALVAECLGSQSAELAQEAGSGNLAEAALPRAFPGILTVSISGEHAYGPDADALDDFEELLGSEAGSKLLGRGDNSAPGKVIATRRIGGALYVLIEATTANGSPILAQRFWRAFININERLVLVTVSSFTDRPIAEDAMLGFLAQQMVILRRVNGQLIDREESGIADNMMAALDVAGERGGVTQARAKTIRVASTRSAPLQVPIPPQRFASAGNGVGGPAPRSASVSAPNKSPAAPHRP